MHCTATDSVQSTMPLQRDGRSLSQMSPAMRRPCTEIRHHLSRARRSRTAAYCC